MNCLNCKEKIHEIRSTESRKYCSNLCQQTYQHTVKYTAWEAGIALDAGVPFYRRAVAQRDGYVCDECGRSSWQDKPLCLELDHIDGNADNNQSDNLRLLCPNCHSQTPTFRNKNKGNGRAFRRKQK